MNTEKKLQELREKAEELKEKTEEVNKELTEEELDRVAGGIINSGSNRMRP